MLMKGYLLSRAIKTQLLYKQVANGSVEDR